MAGLIPQSFIDDLLNRVDIIDVVGSRISLKRSGKNYSACCPFHNEKTPSFTVSPDKQFYYCFGCGASGSALGFVMEYDHLDFPQAVEVLARQVGLDVPYEENAGGAARQSIESPLYNLILKASEFYQQSLRTHSTKKMAVDYFKQRGLTGVIARDFALGFAPPGWDNLIKHFEADDSQQKQLIDAGLVVESADTGKRYDRFRERVMFPIRDVKGRVIAFGGRVLGDDKPKYLNSPETPVFHKSEVLYGLYEVRKNNRHLDEILVLEGYMDVIALAQFGITNGVATLGTATSEEHIKKLFRLVNNILFCFDGDAAGRKAAWRALESALPHLQDGRKVRFLFLPDGDDPDSLVRKEGVDAFKARMSQQAQSLTDYFFNHLTEEAKPTSLEGKAHLASIVTPLLTKMPSGGLKALMYQKLEELTGLDQQHLLAIKPVASHVSQQVPAATAAPFIPADEPVLFVNKAKKVTISPAMSALHFLLQHPSSLQKVEGAEKLTEIPGIYGQLLSQAIIFLKKEPRLNRFQLLGKLSSYDKEGVLTTLLNKDQLVSDQNDLEKEFVDTILMLIKQQSELAKQNQLQELLKKGNMLTDDEKDQLRYLLAAKTKND
ncbi:DNA primase [Entomomonas moraniae]|uniref:DNA primase n=1 Tax=Entomomonas moraniae TaxID=2213226 RepID=A0A3S9XDT8_9GAMM|nr:DNA primase [Entomomonas moraniae]AZS50551.1 DNA primase [Entomomonas moraniae]